MRRYRKSEGIPLFKLWIHTICFNNVFYIKRTPKCGFGVFARRKITFEEAKNSLLGWLAPIFADDFERLNEARHPSLYGSPSGDCFILYGALSLVNHSCVANVAFGNPTKVPSAILNNESTTPSFVRLDNDPITGVKLLQIKSTVIERDHPGYEEDEEITVNYGNRAVLSCQCVKCANNSDELTMEEPARKQLKKR